MRTARARRDFMMHQYLNLSPHRHGKAAGPGKTTVNALKAALVVLRRKRVGHIWNMSPEQSFAAIGESFDAICARAAKRQLGESRLLSIKTARGVRLRALCVLQKMFAGSLARLVDRLYARPPYPPFFSDSGLHPP
jgi:hypothetical protein